MSLVLAALAAAQPVISCDIITFSRSPGLNRTTEQVGICHDPESTRTERHHWFQRSATGADSVAFASTRSCPRARAQLEALERLALPSPDVPGLGSELQIMTLDGVRYRLQTRALYGQSGAGLTVESNLDTPLARWINEALEALAPCWRDKP